ASWAVCRDVDREPLHLQEDGERLCLRPAVFDDECALHAIPRASRSPLPTQRLICDAIADRGTVACVKPAATAAAGIPYTTQLSSSWASTWPPARRIARSPSTPSSPIPVRTTATHAPPHTSATDSKRTDPDGRKPPTGSAPETAMVER